MMPVFPHAPHYEGLAVMSSYLKHHTWLSMHNMHLGIVHQIYNVKRLKCKSSSLLWCANKSL